MDKIPRNGNHSEIVNPGDKSHSEKDIKPPASFQWKKVTPVDSDDIVEFFSELEEADEGVSTMVAQKTFTTVKESGEQSQHNYYIRELERKEDHISKDIYENEMLILKRLFSDTPNADIPESLAVPVAISSDYDEDDEEDVMHIYYPDYGISLQKMIDQDTLTEEQALVVLRDTLQGLSWMHQKEVVHYDINYSNILIDDTTYPDDQNIKTAVIDYGKSKSFHPDDRNTGPKSPASFSDGIADDLTCLFIITDKLQESIQGQQLPIIQDAIARQVEKIPTIADHEELKQLANNIYKVAASIC